MATKATSIQDEKSKGSERRERRRYVNSHRQTTVIENSKFYWRGLPKLLRMEPVRVEWGSFQERESGPLFSFRTSSPRSFCSRVIGTVKLDSPTNFSPWGEVMGLALQRGEPEYDLEYDLFLTLKHVRKEWGLYESI